MQVCIVWLCRSSCSVSTGLTGHAVGIPLGVPSDLVPCCNAPACCIRGAQQPKQQQPQMVICTHASNHCSTAFHHGVPIQINPLAQVMQSHKVHAQSLLSTELVMSIESSGVTPLPLRYVTDLIVRHEDSAFKRGVRERCAGPGCVDCFHPMTD